MRSKKKKSSNHIRLAPKLVISLAIIMSLMQFAGLLIVHYNAWLDAAIAGRYLDPVLYYAQAALIIVIAFVNGGLKYIAFALALNSCIRIGSVVLSRPHVVRRLLIAQRRALQMA